MMTLTASALRVAVPEDPAVSVVISGRDDARPHAGSVGVPPEVAVALDGQHGHRLHPVGVLANRADLAAAAGLDAADVVWAEQVHAAGVATVGTADRGRGARAPQDAVPSVDALLTRDDDVGVAVRAADCVPVILVDPGRGVAAVHAGRAGVEAGILPAALRALAPDAHRVVGIVGPAIGGCCYEVPRELRARVAARVPAAATTTTWGRPALDLPRAVTAALHAGGVARVEAVGGCTRCRPGWFSHRAARATDRDAPAGRHAALVVRHHASRPRRMTSTGTAGSSLEWGR